jgi:hypothetical protein
MEIEQTTGDLVEQAFAEPVAEVHWRGRGSLFAIRFQSLSAAMTCSTA